MDTLHYILIALLVITNVMHVVAKRTKNTVDDAIADGLDVAVEAVTQRANKADAPK